MNRQLNIIMPVIVSIMVAGPVWSQSQLSNNQPVRGDLHVREAGIQAKMKTAFKAGQIDSTELASFQRDFDGILVKENNFKNRSDGMTDSGRETIFNELDVFEARLDRHANKTQNKTASDPLKVNQ